MEPENSSQTQTSSPVYSSSPFASYGNGWKVLKANFWVLIGVTLITVLLSGLGGNLDELGLSELEQLILWVASVIFGLFVVNPIYIGSSWTFLKAVRGESVKLSDMFEGFRRNFMSAVLAPVLSSFIAGAAAAVFGVGLAVSILVPGEFAAKPILIGGFILLLVLSIFFAFYVSIRLSFTNYLILDKSLQPLPAIKESWALTREHFADLLGLSMLAIPIVIGGVLLLVVGIFPAFAWIGCASASMYQAILVKESQK
jgi:hypothetical protein